MDRESRRERWSSLFSPWALAVAGASIATAFLFQRSLAIKAIMFICFFGAAWLSGKKVSIPATLLVSFGIVFANLLVPVGKVLVVFGSFKVTEIALIDGIGKALVLEGLLYVSKATILPGLRLPGRFGALIAAAFVYYDRIVEYKGSIRPATLIEDADRLMLKVWETPAACTGGEAGDGSRPFALVGLAAAVIAAYAPILLAAFK